MENQRFAEEGDPWFVCKHCDAACGEANEDEGFSEPSGVLVAQPPVCDGCDEYLHACDCEPDDDGADHSSEGSDLSDRCVLGAACCCPHIFHGPEECFSAEDAEANWGAETDSPRMLDDCGKCICGGCLFDERCGPRYQPWSPYPEPPAGNPMVES